MEAAAERPYGGGGCELGRDAELGERLGRAGAGARGEGSGAA